MSPVCFVTERLFPLESIDDWALELHWRARSLSRSGTPVFILWISANEIAPPDLDRARQYYKAMGINLRVKEDLWPFMEPDEPLHRSLNNLLGLLAFPALNKLHSRRHFGRIEISAEHGLAFRVVQAQRAGLAFTDTELVVTLGHFGEWQRHEQARIAVRADEIRHDFTERESVELAPCVVTTQPDRIPFAAELGWESERIRLRPLPQLETTKEREIGTRTVPCYFGNPEEDWGFEQFRLLVEKAKVFPRWLHAEESHHERGSLARRQTLEAASKNSRSRVEFLANPDWASFAALLREKQAFAILNQSGIGPRLGWLLQESIPFVFPESLLAAVPESQRSEAAAIAYDGRYANSLYSALKNARNFAHWSPLLAAWRESFSASSTNASVADTAVPTHPVVEPPTGQPRVTIAVSHYNLKQLLSETLECLEVQTYPACDVVVVDDGSNDPESRQAWDACKERFPRFSFIDLPHHGYWSPRNHAIEHCTNPYIIIVDGDNLPRPEMAEVFVRAMERNPEFAAFTSYIAAFSEERQAALRGEFQALNAPLGGDIVSGYFQNIFGDTNSIFRVEALRAIKGFRENFRCAFGDWELFHRLVGQGHRLGVIPKVLLHYRRRAGGMIRQRSLYREHWEFFQVLDAATQMRPADRRRFSFALHGLASNKT